ncbi:hypothetical protein GGR16_002618 [Chelatococcus caeni]|uniref:Phage major capsid protein n=2 Tax=Chelatococcaceae TaxID=2036754 RepID=A0A840BX11_9HYPH|nr:hypothetical protein AL346_00085 [Chelatococcus sp. CO-6]MBB4017584.1 hypothetical protein [Chelatococcus caeni]
MDTPNVHVQSIHERPLYDWLMAKQKTFPGSKEFLQVRVQGDFPPIIEGWSGDQTVGYDNPAYVKVASYPYKRIHAGISFTADELIRNGISIVDTTTGQGDSVHSRADKLQLVNLLENKVMTMRESMKNDMNEMFWGDGTLDPELVPGLRSFIVDDPTAPLVVGGIDQGAPENWWWRNRANLAIDLGTDPKEQRLLRYMDNEIVQLSKYRARPDRAFAGSDMLQRFKDEMRLGGYFSMDGFRGNKDLGTGGIYFNGIEIHYDPTLDDLGYSKRLYLLDSKHIRPLVVQGENMKRHNPARPPEKYVYYRAVTWVGGLVCDQRNSSGVYAFA